MLCKICNNQTKHKFNKTVLLKYDVKYFQCPNCNFLQTEKPFWLTEAYNAAISDLDTGILSRNNSNVLVTKKIINYFFDTEKQFLDYGGGYGIFTRMMRDEGFDMYNYDKFCKHLFSKSFSVKEIVNKYELITAFELFEHIEHPLEQMKELLKYTDNIFISTSLQPDNNTELINWNYLVPEAGQHISLYSLESLKIIASSLNLNLLSNGSNYHLFTKIKKNKFIFRLICSSKTNKFLPLKSKLQSLTLKDYHFILNQTKEKNEHKNTSL